MTDTEEKKHLITEDNSINIQTKDKTNITINNKLIQQVLQETKEQKLKATQSL